MDCAAGQASLAPNKGTARGTVWPLLLKVTNTKQPTVFTPYQPHKQAKQLTLFLIPAFALKKNKQKKTPVQSKLREAYLTPK